MIKEKQALTSQRFALRFGQATFAFLTPCLSITAILAALHQAKLLSPFLKWISDNQKWQDFAEDLCKTFESAFGKKVTWGSICKIASILAGAILAGWLANSYGEVANALHDADVKNAYQNALSNTC